MRRCRAVRSFAALLFILAGASSSAAKSPCDPALQPPEDTAYAYKLRGNRCEGIYVRNVAGKHLDLVSITESVEDFVPGSGRALIVEWSAPPQAAIHLRATGIQPNLYYRMDADLLPADASFTWPSSLLHQLELTRKNLGVLAWTLQTAGAAGRRVYVPLRVRQQTSANRSSRYQVVVVPGVALKEVYVRLKPWSATGNAGAALMNGEPLGRGFYPADRPIVIELAPMKAAGIYLLEIGATLEESGTASETIHLYSPGL